MDKKYLTTQTISIGLFLSTLFFVLSIDMSKTYDSEISILISPKSEVAARAQKQIVASVVELPKTLAFYDRILKYNPDVRDVAKGLSPQERKAHWNEVVSVQQAGFDSSVIKINVVTSHEVDSIQLAQKTARTLFDTISFYYDVKKDLNMTVIDGPITRAQVPNLPWLFFVSVALGFAISIFLQLRIFEGKKSVGEFLKKKPFFDFKKTSKVSKNEELEALNNLYKNEEQEKMFVFEQKNKAEELLHENLAEAKKEDPKIREMKKLTKKIEPGKYPNFPEMPIHRGVKSSAPENLPIADDSFFGSYGENQETISSIEAESQEAPSDKKEEPTPEELKKRLNQLLRGDF